ncbi:hypothetical protein K440DRAFT_659737 [Wilcoxina mikolae CBS 423.85]|nr:hypothetical protein K440DRAFT_659737 [Wilcoxina mikolae CBS 423.85]
MSGYIPANTYDPAPPEYDNNGYPLQQFPQPQHHQQQQQQQYHPGGTPYTPPAWSATTGFGYTGVGTSDQEALLKDQKLYQSTPSLSQTPTTPQTPYPGHPEHRESTLFHAPVNHALRHRYRKIKQFRRLFFRVITRWITSCVFSGAIIALLIYYASLGVLDKGQKYMFNALYLGASLLLALNIVASFKGMAGLFRWKVLASVSYGGHSAKELDLILGMSSYGTSTKLLKHWIGKSKYFILLLLWVILGVGAQVVLSLLGLTFSHESDGAQKTSPGTVNASDLNAFHISNNPVDIHWPWFHEQNYRSHLYGDISQVLGQMDDGGSIPIELDESMVDIIYMNTTNSFKYYFKEYNYQLHGKTLTAKTNRYVTVSAKCVWSSIVRGQEGGTNETVIININGSNTKSEEHNWANSNSGRLYFNPNVHANETERALLANESYTIDPNQFLCGPRCGLTYVYRFLHNDELNQNPLPPGDFFNCSTTISTVHNASLQQHILPDPVAVRAASSIGSNSIWTPYPEKKMAYQLDVFSSASPWDNWYNLTGESAAFSAEYNLARFAIGSIAVLDVNNPRIEIPGNRPWIGVFLQVKWRWVWVIIGSLLVSQLLLGIGTVIVANTVFCKDESFLSTARLLRPLMLRLGESGCAATGNEIAGLFGNTHLRYGVRRDAQGRNHLDVLLDTPVVEEGGWVNKGVGWPRGYYE